MKGIGVVLAGVVAISACGRKPSRVAKDAAETSAARVEERVDVVEPVETGRIYSEAVRRARAEISADNARARLDEIERQIDEEATGLR